jgi:hypothetical protein
MEETCTLGNLQPATSIGGSIAWKSQKQPTVALSTTEAVHMATVDASRQAIWVKELLQHLHRDDHQTSTILTIMLALWRSKEIMYIMTGQKILLFSSLC